MQSLTIQLIRGGCDGEEKEVPEVRHGNGKEAGRVVDLGLDLPEVQTPRARAQVKERAICLEYCMWMMMKTQEQLFKGTAKTSFQM